jgi:acetoacetyl-CoA synthetase
MTAPLLRAPADDVLTSTEIGRFLTWLERHRQLRFTDYAELHRWSVHDLDGFWSAVWEFFGVQGQRPVPIGLWGDPGGTRYRETYFAKYPGIWRHGDRIRFSAVGSCVITGRSDATLNRGGVRLGTAEFYQVVEELPEVLDSLVVHLEDPDGGNGELLLYLQLGEGRSLDPLLRELIVTALHTALSPRHLPDTITAVAAIPRNRTGKKLELPVKRILQREQLDDVVSREVLADPTALEPFIAHAALRSTR